MGVRGLHSYLSYHCPNARHVVFLPDVIFLESERTGQRPVIVVDAPSCYSLWCANLDWTIGLQVKEMIGRLKSFVDTFNSMGADLVFFIGGFTPLKKRPTWLRRRIDGMNKMMEVCDLLYAGQTHENIPRNLNSIPPNMGNFVAFVLKHVLNCTVFQTIRECDDEIIHFVSENNCFAIFAFDTDFLISQVNCKILGADTYDGITKTTYMYDRNALCSHLGIAVDQLPLLAILIGNDIINQESLRQFHHRVCVVPESDPIPYNKLIKHIAAYINSLPRRITSQVFRKICLDVFNDQDMVPLMMRGYYAYTPHGTADYYCEPDAWSRTMKVAKVRFQQQVLLPPSAWGVMNKLVYESSVCLEDMRRINNQNDDVKLRPSATITRNLRRRFYGVLLFEKRQTQPVVREWCAENTDSYTRTVKVIPEYPEVHHPGLRALWKDNKIKKGVIFSQWKLFLFVVSPAIDDIGAWMSLPGHLVVSTAACYYLYREEFYLTEDETNAILMTLAMVSVHDSVNLDVIKIMKRDIRSPRASDITMKFSRTYSLVFATMATCGFPVKLSKDTAHIKFEPSLFHFLFRNLTQMSVYFDALCQSDTKILKNLQKMKDIMFNGHVIM